MKIAPKRKKYTPNSFVGFFVIFYFEFCHFLNYFPPFMVKKCINYGVRQNKSTKLSDPLFEYVFFVWGEGGKLICYRYFNFFSTFLVNLKNNFVGFIFFSCLTDKRCDCFVVCFNARKFLFCILRN